MPAAKEWRFEVSPQAKREIARLPEGLDVEAVETIIGLLDDPTPADCQKLTGYENLYRIRFGPFRGLWQGYRIIYTINEHRRLIRVLRVRPRPAAYRGMRKP